MMTSPNNLQTKKLKVLMVSEASFLSSGFSIYTKEILSRLFKTNKYDIAEFACYGMVNDPRDKDIHWKYYANAVRDDDPRHGEYSSRADNQFGRWRFEKVLLDFRPDVVIDIRDYWMSAYQALSPLRKYFHWILMPTVDSAPQQEEWIDTFLSADSIFTYSDWGADVLKQQSSNKIKYISTASPGVDLSVFKIRDTEQKKIIKSKMGLPEDSIIFGSVMRNQKRKLIPELMISFRKALDTMMSTNPEIASKLYLYLHTSYPDAGWDIPELLKEHRLSNRVFFTYFCKRCGLVASNVFVGALKVCPRCLEKSMGFSSVTNGVTPSQLSEIYGVFDAYVQYSICEGFGCPQTEAGASGLPIFTVNYSAMCDIVKNLEAIAIQPAAYFKELETKAIRVYPDNNQLATEIIRLASMSESERQKLGLKSRELTEKYYNWDLIAKKWENHLDHIAATYRSNWDVEPKQLRHITTKDQPNPNQHIDSLANVCENHLNDPDLLSSMTMLNQLQQIDYGFSMHGMAIHRHSYQDIIDFTNTMVDNVNQSESVRAQDIKFSDDFIQYASIKANTINELII
jgi:glycosyltransferase involved in cell wall biosynthesis